MWRIPRTLISVLLAWELTSTAAVLPAQRCHTRLAPPLPAAMPVDSAALIWGELYPYAGRGAHYGTLVVWRTPPYQELPTVITDSIGRFAFTTHATGQYAITTGSQHLHYRVLYVAPAPRAATYLCIGLDDKQDVVPSHGLLHPWPDEYAYAWRFPHVPAPPDDSAAVGRAMGRHLAATCTVEVDVSMSGLAFTNAFLAMRPGRSSTATDRRYVVDSVLLKSRPDEHTFPATVSPLTGVRGVVDTGWVPPPRRPPQPWGDSARVSLHVIDGRGDEATRMTFHYVFARGPNEWVFASRHFRRAEAPLASIGAIPPLTC